MAQSQPNDLRDDPAMGGNAGKTICPHCGAENPRSLIVTICTECQGPLDAPPDAPRPSSPATRPSAPPKPAPSPIAQRVPRNTTLPPRPAIVPPRPAEQPLPVARRSSAQSSGARTLLYACGIALGVVTLVFGILAFAVYSFLSPSRHTVERYTSTILVINADGAGERPVVTLGGVNSRPPWSPDGRWLAFTSNHVPDGGEGSTGMSRLWRVRSDGSSPTMVTPTDVFAMEAAWSPRGDLIAFLGRQGDGPLGLYTVRPDGAGLAPQSSGGSRYLAGLVTGRQEHRIRASRSIGSRLPLAL